MINFSCVPPPNHPPSLPTPPHISLHDATRVTVGLLRSLDLTGPLLLGGVPKLPEDFPVRNRQFVGCMKNLRVDNQHVDMASFIANNGTLPGRLLPAFLCKSLPGLHCRTIRLPETDGDYYLNYLALLITSVLLPVGQVALPKDISATLTRV